MIAEPSEQRRLLRLAELDADLARVTHSAKTLPQHETIRTLMEARQEVGDALTSATTEADDLEVATRRAESDLVPVRARLERDQQRVDAGEVTDARALQGLLDEIEHLRGRIGDLEDAQLDVMGRAEEARARRDELSSRKAEIEQQLRDEVRARDEAAQGLKQEAQGLVQRRKEAAAAVPQELGKLYERLRATTGIGAARLVESRCGGCRLQLNVSDLAALAKLPANQVARCPECDRILVRVPAH